MKAFLRRNKQILLILAITLAFHILVGLLTKSYILMQKDSDSYSMFTQNIFLGQVNLMRTPLYPLFIMLVRLISFSPSGYIPIVIAQEIVSLISLVFMYKIIKRYTKNNKLIYAFSFIYSLQPTIWHWNKCILTESLSISLCVIFAWLLIQHIDKPKIWSAITIAIGSFLFIMLRPSFLALFAIIIGFWIVRFIFSKIDRKQSAIGFGISMVCLLLLFGYMHLNYLQNGLYGITNVESGNQIMNLVGGDIYQNPEYQDIVDSLIQSPYWSDKKDLLFALGWEPFSKQFGFNFTPKYISDYVSDTIKLHFSGYAKYTGEKFLKTVGYPISSIIPLSTPEEYLADINSGSYNSAENAKWQAITSSYWNINIINFLTFIVLPVPFIIVYIYLAWVLIYAIVKWAKGKLDWIDLGFSLIVIAQFVTFIISVPPYQYSRLLVPALPFLFVLVYKHITEGRFGWFNMKFTKTKAEGKG